MIRNLAKTLCIVGAIGCAPLMRAQLVNDFSNFADGNQAFLGTWAANGDPFFGDLNPIGSFTQGTGVYNFTGGDNSFSSGAEYFFTSNLDLSSSNALALTLELLPSTSTPAGSLTVTLYDLNSIGASATFQLSDFNASTYTTGTVVFTPDAGFDATQVAYVLITGNDPVGGSSIDISVDNLAAVSTTAVPEPGTYAALAGAAALGLVAWRRRRTA